MEQAPPIVPDELLTLWHRQHSAMTATPYRGDAVQAWGLAFALVYNRRKSELCARFGINPDEFNYGMKHIILKKLEEENESA